MRNILLGSIIILQLSFQERKRSVSGAYLGYWGATVWKYTFNGNNHFVFKTDGHFGNFNTEGTYSIVADTIFLKSFPKKRQKGISLVNFRDTLFIDGDSCIVQLSTGVDYCKQKPEDIDYHISRQRLKAE